MVTLYRGQSTDQGTFGTLEVNGKVWHSLELPWRDNQQSISCIPSGEYEAKIRYSPSFKRNTYHIKDVKGRSYILIHGANFAGDVSKGWQSHLEGCITLGKGKGVARNKHGNPQQCVFTSRTAIREFMDEMGGQPFKITIKDERWNG